MELEVVFEDDWDLRNWRAGMHHFNFSDVREESDAQSVGLHKLKDQLRRLNSERLTSFRGYVL